MRKTPTIQSFQEIVRAAPGDSKTVRLIRKAIRDGAAKILAQVQNPSSQRYQVSGGFTRDIVAGRMALVQSELDIRDGLVIKTEVIEAMKKILGKEIHEDNFDPEDKDSLFLFEVDGKNPEFPFAMRRVEPYPLFGEADVQSYVRLKRILGEMYHPLGIADCIVEQLKEPPKKSAWITWDINDSGGVYPCYPCNIGLGMRPFSMQLPRPMPLIDLINQAATQGSLQERLMKALTEARKNM